LYNATPMLFMPLLNEQFFWAKNYQKRTGIPFIDHRTYHVLRDTATFKIVLQKAMASNKYIEAARKSMLIRNGASELVGVIGESADAKSKSTKAVTYYGKSAKIRRVSDANANANSNAIFDVLTKQQSKLYHVITLV
jgi:hypothetical protein